MIEVEIHSVTPDDLRNAADVISRFEAEFLGDFGPASWSVAELENYADRIEERGGAFLV